MNVLIVDEDCCGLDLAYRAAEAGHKVRWWMPKDEGETHRDGDGFPGIEKVTNWRSSMKWAKEGLVISMYNGKCLKELDEWREFGVPVFAPSCAAAALEVKREEGMKLLERCGIDTPPFETFKSLEDASAFAWKADKPWVFKTLGNEEDKSLSFVASDPAQLAGWIDRQIEKGMKLKGPCMLQERVDGIEMGVSGWFGTAGFLKDKWNINFEHKKLMSSDYGPNTGEMGCYDAETEVLTRSGWKFWPDVTSDDEIASLQNDETVFVKPSEVVSYDYVGPMICWKNRAIDICVTPNHNMYVNGQCDARHERNGYKFVRADQCDQAQYEIKRTAGWAGSSQDFYEVPPCTYGKGKGFVTAVAKQIAMIAWARFLGIYIAEGSASRGQLNISQSHAAKASRVAAILDATAIKYARYENGFVIHNTQIARHLGPIGRSWEKRVPQYIKDGSREVIEAFLEGYALGDGHMYPGGYRAFYTSNKSLADDTQELLLKTGRVGTIINRGMCVVAKMAPDGHEIIQRRDAYVVIERVQKLTSWLDARDRTARMYSGKVYCATVPGHVMFVRRNGKPFWCGNTLMQYVTKEKMATDILLPLEKELLKLKHTGDFAVNCIVDKKGKAWPLEFTVRMGYPALLIMMQCHRGDPVQWMKDALSGHDTLKVKTDVAAGVVLAIPPFPGEEDPDEVIGNPIYGVEDVWEQVSPTAMMLAPGADMKGGKVVKQKIYQSSGATLGVVTGLGKTVTKAVDAAFKAIDEIKVSNLMVRDDIGESLEEELPVLHKLGYAIPMEYA